MEPFPSTAAVLSKLQALGVTLPPGPIRLDGYGDSATLSEELLELIRQGANERVSLLWAMEAENEHPPRQATSR